MTTSERPHSIDAEQAVLGSCLIDRDVILRLAPWLSSEMFYEHRHRLIYRAILTLYWARVPADLVAVVDELQRAGELERVGGETYLGELIAATPTSVHAGYYAGIVADHWTRRRLIESGTEIVRLGFESSLPVHDAVAKAELALTKATAGSERNGAESMSEIVEGYLESMESGEVALTVTGFRQLDEQILGGIAPGDLVIVGAQTSVGKSAFATNIARYNAREAGKRVLVVSLEMRAREYLTRLLAIETGINSRKLGFRGAALDEQERWMAQECSAQLSEWPLMIDARSSGRVEDVCSRARNAAVETGLDLLIVDHMGLMRSSQRTDNRNLEMGNITQQLKHLAMELEVPVFALHQLNRAPSHRKDGRPVLSDLRDSGNVEQDADIVMFLHRPGMQNPERPRDLTEVIVAKHRNGPVGSVYLSFEEHTTRFLELRGLAA